MGLESIKEMGWALIYPFYKPIAYKMLLDERKKKSKQRRARLMAMEHRASVTDTRNISPRSGVRPSDNWSRTTFEPRRKPTFEDVKTHYNTYRTICTGASRDYLEPHEYVVRARKNGWDFLKKSVNSNVSYNTLRDNFGG